MISTTSSDSITVTLKRLVSWAVIFCLIGEQTAVLAAGNNLPTGFRAIRGAGTYSESGSVGTVRQGSSRAVYGWDTFNIGAGNTVNFRQNPGDVALNRIFDQSPSQILGNLNADATVYLINPNGVVFGKNGRVNVGSLTASTLDVVNDNIFMGSTTDGSQLSEKSLIKAIGGGKAAFQTADGSASNTGKITINNGAEINSKDANGQMYLASQITNNGKIKATNGGQIIMAAAKDKVYLAEPDANSELRGVIVEVNTGGSINNNGSIKSERGNVTLAGLAINQNGRISATTAVSAAGSIRLQARDNVTVVDKSAYPSLANRDSRGGLIDGTASVKAPVASNGGTLVFSEKSITEVVADPSSPEASSGLAQSKPAIEGIAKTIQIKEKSLLSARGGRVELVAAGDTAKPGEVFANDGASLVMEKGSRIDVSGLSSKLAIEKSNLVVQRVTGTSLADSPLQRDGILRNKTVSLPIREGGDIEIIDVEGDLAAVNKTLSQRLGEGGSVDLKSTGTIIQSAESKIDISGGRIDYAGGDLKTTYVIEKGRTQPIPLSQADPDIVYDKVFDLTRKVDGFHEGLDAGSLTVSTKQLLLAKNGIVAGSDIGLYQRNNAPSAGKVVIDLTYAQANTQAITVAGLDAFEKSFDASLKKFASTGKLEDFVLLDTIAVGGLSELKLTAARPVVVASDANINLRAGGKLTVNGRSEYTRVLQPDSGCDEAGAGNCTVNYLNRDGVTVEGKVHIAAGSVTLNSTLGASKLVQGDALPDQKTEVVAIDQRSVRNDVNAGMTIKGNIDVSGNVVNDAARVSKKDAQIAPNGGSIVLSAEGDINLTAKSRLSANAGLYRQSSSGAIKDKFGNAGSISLSAKNQEVLNIALADSAKLDLRGQLSAFGAEKGGSLSLTSAGFVLYDKEKISTSFSSIDLTKPYVFLDNNFFNKSGFSSFSLTSTTLGGRIEADTTIQLRNKSWELSTNNQLAQLAYADSLSPYVNTLELPAYQRGAVNFSFAVEQGDFELPSLQMFSDSSLLGEPGAKISLTSANDLFVDGLISAPGGNIALKINGKSGYIDNKALLLGNNSILNVAGAFEVSPVAASRDVSDYLAYGNGKVSLDAASGYLLAEEGALIDLHGEALSNVVKSTTGARFVENMAADAGELSIKVSEALLFDAIVDAHAAPVDGASGGKLSIVQDFSIDRVGIDRFSSLTPAIPVDPSVIQIQKSDIGLIGINLISRDEYGELETVGNVYNHLVNDLNLAANTTVLDSNLLQNSGFDSLSLRVTNTRSANSQTTQRQLGRVVFNDDINLVFGNELIIDSPTIETNANKVGLNSAYLRLGNNDSEAWQRQSQSLTSGNGYFVAKANFIDLMGNLTIRGADQVSLLSKTDLRLRGAVDGQNGFTNGQLNSADQLTLQADQIYPVTLFGYDITTGNSSGNQKSGKITILPGNDANAQAFSVGGKLTLNSKEIVQSGTLKAPLGEITLNADKITMANGSLTSMSLDAAMLPFGRIENGTDWIYTLPNKTLVFSATPDASKGELPLPQKNLDLNASSIDFAKGATIDSRGDGDLFAFEFIKGPGGSKDILAPENSGDSFAILPANNLGYAAWDFLDAKDSSIANGQTFTLSRTLNLGKGNSIKAGTYAVLPARYALMPGAFLVTPAQVDRLQSSESIRQANRSPIVAGRLGISGTEFIDSEYSGFVIDSADIVKQRSEYDIRYANEFFADSDIYQKPRDGGDIAFTASEDLRLGGALLASGAAANAELANAAGRGGALDIQVDNIRVLAQKGAAKIDGVIDLFASELNALDVQSLLLGGKRNRTEDIVELAVGADRVTIGDNVELSGREIIAVAKESVAVGDDVSFIGRAVDEIQPETELAINGDAALFAVSQASDIAVRRDTIVNPQGGYLSIGKNITYNDFNSLAFDVSRKLTLNSLPDFTDGNLAIGAPAIRIGGGSGNGLTLSSSLLNQLDVAELTLRSGGSIDVYGDVTLNLNALKIDAAGIRQIGNLKTFSINANQVTLDNRYQRDVTGTFADINQLRINTETLQFGLAETAAPVEFLFDGIGYVDINANTELVDAGKMAIDLGDASVVSIATPVWRGVGGSDISIDVDNNFSLKNNGVNQVADLGLGDKLSITADAIDIDTNILMPSGVVQLNAIGSSVNDDLVLGSKAVLDVSGVSVALGPKTVNTDAGSIALLSKRGDIVNNSGSELRLDAAAKKQAGVLSIDAANGQWLRSGKITAEANRQDRGGELSINVKSENNFADLLNLADTGDFSRVFNYRQHEGNLNIAANQTIKAEKISLVTDGGNVTVAGVLDARGIKGGEIQLHANDNILISGSLQAGAYDNTKGKSAKFSAEELAVAANGGNVLINSANGAIQLTGASDIDLARRGTDRVANGELRLRAIRSANDVPVTLAGQFSNIDGVVIEAVKNYLNISVVDTALLDTIKQDMTDFWANAGAAVLQKFNGLSNPAIGRLEVAADISSDSAMTIEDTVDTSAWRFGNNSDQVGNITFRSAGDLFVNANITDGVEEFVPPPDDPSYCLTNPGDCKLTMKTDNSFGFRVVAGADLASANPLSVKMNTGDLVLSYEDTLDPVDPSATKVDATVIRTGTGDIAISAGRDVIFQDPNNAIYTMGRATPIRINTVDGERGFPVVLGVNVLNAYIPNPNYPIDGGDIALQAGRNISVNTQSSRYLRDENGAVVLNGQGNPVVVNTSNDYNYFVTDWLHRAGSSKVPATWAVDFSKFRHGIATLGGGDILVNAGNNISALAVASATTGKQVGDFDVSEDREFTIRSSLVDVQGGGDVVVNAQGDIADLALTVMRGNAQVSTNANLTSSELSYGNLFGIGDASLTINALGDVKLGSLFNPTVAPQSDKQAKNEFGVITPAATSYFFTYSDQSAVTSSSLTGDIVFEDGNSQLITNYDYFSLLEYPDAAKGLLSILPARLSSASLQGDIILQRDLNLYASSKGSASLLAKGNIFADSDEEETLISLPDGDPDLLPRVAKSENNIAAINAGGIAFGFFDQILRNAEPILNINLGVAKDDKASTSLLHAEQPLHANDDNALTLVAGTGDLGSEKKLSIDSSSRVFAYAGNDVVNTRFNIQHSRNRDISVVQAGNDISFVTPRTENGTRPGSSNLTISVAGPGSLQVLAGGDIDLGISDGIVTRGDQFNPVLADTGADVIVAAGLTDFDAGVNAYENRYLDNKATLVEFVLSSRFAGDLGSVVTASTGDNYSNEAQARQALKALFANPATRNQAIAIAQKAYDKSDLYTRLELVVPAFLNEIKQGGIESLTKVFADPKLNGFARSFAAIDTLFANPGSGKISLTDAKIQTEDGGAIRFLIPNGDMNVGLAAGAGIQAGRTQGIIASGIGSIEGYALNSINVNRSRIFALDGGDVLLFSRKGDIDAGRGATTVQSIPPPRLVFDENGNATVVTSAALTGSGILTGCYSAGCKPSNTYLFAPGGKIDAGDAGIRSEGQIFLGSPIVIAPPGSISAGGSVVGGAPAAPSSDGGVNVGNFSDSAMQSASESVDQSVSNMDEQEESTAILSIDLLSTGDDEDSSNSSDDKEKEKNRKKNPRLSAL